MHDCHGGLSGTFAVASCFPYLPSALYLQVEKRQGRKIEPLAKQDVETHTVALNNKTQEVKLENMYVSEMISINMGLSYFLTIMTCLVLIGYTDIGVLFYGASLAAAAQIFYYISFHYRFFDENPSGSSSSAYTIWLYGFLFQNLNWVFVFVVQYKNGAPNASTTFIIFLLYFFYLLVFLVDGCKCSRHTPRTDDKGSGVRIAIKIWLAVLFNITFGFLCQTALN